ncbi:hypothetical protein BUALT_Bualt07G0038500 [Buddleja alternifolia]|uniref:Uncharacterized protein n=1 Tax=Buddleja alternifolia TaxID=168488 RepID=A0AAV6XEI8_9LAMI|nr:hypothetical protein BUALT_Bualt07G0038500 [Buddleja alternifolia]
MGCRNGNRWRGSAVSKRTGCEKVFIYFVRKGVDHVVEANVKENVSAHNVEKKKRFDDNCDFISSRKSRKVSTAKRGLVSASIARKQLATKLFEGVNRDIYNHDYPIINLLPEIPKTGKL